MKEKTSSKNERENTRPRPPVVAVMGHIDHGKSSLLDYIRNTDVVAKEAGGITQHVSAYEVTHKAKDGLEHKITFLDTPGHEAFQSLRMRGVHVADIAILVVSAEDGVKPQTLDALSCIKEAGAPYVVAINKIDLPNADIERTKQSLAEHEIFIEGYGGDIPAVAVSAKSGVGVSELLDMIILVAELEELTADEDAPGEGVVLESNLDPKKGITATLIIQNGTVSQGMCLAAGESLSPVRIMEDFAGHNIKKATFSSPIRIIGWDTLPSVGATFKSFKTRKEAEAHVLEMKEKGVAQASAQKQAAARKAGAGGAGAAKADGGLSENGPVVIPVILRADTGGSLEVLEEKIERLQSEQVKCTVVQSGIGSVSESDIKLALGNPSSVVIAFHSKADPRAVSLAERSNVEIHSYDVIYKLLEWLEKLIAERRPHVSVEESLGKAKVMKIFSAVKSKQVLGGKVEAGLITSGSQVKILRREAMLGTGKIRELQRQKEKVSEISEGNEFGAMIESKIEIAPGDRLEAVRIVEKQI